MRKPHGVRHSAKVQVRRDPRKVKSSFSLRAPCVTSSRVEATTVLLSPGNAAVWSAAETKRTQERARFSSSGSACTLPSPRAHPSQPSRALLPPYSFIPSRHSTHRQVAGVILIGLAAIARPPRARVRERVEARKSVLSASALLVRSCIFQKPSKMTSCLRILTLCEFESSSSPLCTELIVQVSPEIAAKRLEKDRRKM